ncbi:helix-turn-helix transcriptional regulator [Actinosynnema sp. NPDC050436]|uniref:helix-turn-helix domain-containing protein n=1 Tax=Actinosynnema sp. NPDC050436 TaxID=3155659 RepID=UPI0033EAFCBB
MPFGARLRRLRMAQNVSLTELARRTHYSKGYLSKVENGAQAPSPTLIRQCDGALAAGGELISRYRSDETRPTTPTRSPVDDTGRNWMLHMDDQGSLWFRPMGRRQALTAGAASILVLGGAGPARARAGTDAVSAFTTMFGHVRALGQQSTPEVVLPTLVAQTQTLRGLAADASGRTRRDLLVLASRYAEYTGWMAQEAGRAEAALWWTDAAVDLAEAGGDDEVAAYSLVRQALVSMYARRSADTVALARRAYEHPAASPRVRGLASQREAQGHAIGGDTSACLRALDRAESLLDRVDDSDPSTRLGSTTLANPVRLTRAWCLHDLGRSREAIEVFDRELSATPPGARRFRARWQARRTVSVALAGELDQACAMVPGLLADCAQVDSWTIRTDLAALSEILRHHLSKAAVRNVYPALSAALQAT